jgi:hypothetical protein
MSHQRQLFNKNQFFYYKSDIRDNFLIKINFFKKNRVMKGDEWRMCRRALLLNIFDPSGP